MYKNNITNLYCLKKMYVCKQIYKTYSSTCIWNYDLRHAFKKINYSRHPLIMPLKPKITPLIRPLVLLYIVNECFIYTLLLIYWNYNVKNKITFFLLFLFYKLLLIFCTVQTQTTCMLLFLEDKSYKIW